MALLKLLHLHVCIAVLIMMVGAESMVLISFDRAPPARSRFSTAVFQYTFNRSDGSNACKNNGCSIYCELDGQTLRPCPPYIAIFKNLTRNREHHFLLNITTQDGARNSSFYSWFIDTIPPTATIFTKQTSTNAEKMAIILAFSEPCTGEGGFKCVNSTNCDVMVNGPAVVQASSLHVIEPNIKYGLQIVFGETSTYARVVIKMADKFCTDQAGNYFTRTNGSVLIVHLDRRPVQGDLWTSIPSYVVNINGVPRTVLATNKPEDFEIFLDFSSPVMNSTQQILNALHVNSGKFVANHGPNHGNRRFDFKLTDILRTEIIKVKLEAGSVISMTGTPVSPVAPLTFLYDSSRLGVGLSTNSPRVTKEPNINVVVEFTKPVFGFEASMVKVEGGKLTRFKEVSRALYSLTVLIVSQSVASITVPAGNVNDVSGNLNLASNQLEVKHYSVPSISLALHSFVTAGVLATSLATAVLSISSANLGAISTVATGSTNTVASGPSMNLDGMVGHLQMFVLSDWFSDSLPIEYSETIKGLRWLIPRQTLPWRKESTSIWPDHYYLAQEKLKMLPRNQSIEYPSQGRAYHSSNLSSTNSSSSEHGLFPTEIYSRGGWLRRNISMKDAPYGQPLDSNEYFVYFLRGEPLSASNVIGRMKNDKGWQILEMNLFWLGVAGGGLLVTHILTFIFLRWRTGTPALGILSVPRFELFLLILMLPCISQSSAFVIRGGTTGGIITGVLLLAIPTAHILSVSLFLIIAIFSGSFAQYKEVKHVGRKERWCTKLWVFFTGRSTTGKWFSREGLPSSFLQRYGVLFESRKGPPLYVLVDQSDPNNLPKWIESGRSGIGRMRGISSDDNNEKSNVPLSKRLLGCAKSFYIILDLIRRVILGILSGVYSSRRSSQSFFALTITLVQFLYLLTFKPYIRRGVHMAESVSLLSEIGLFGISISINGSNPMKEKTLGFIMLALLFLTFVSQITNEWYAMIKYILRLSPPQKNSFKLGLKKAAKGFILPFLPRNHWSSVLPEASQPKTGLAPVLPLSPDTELERRNATVPHVDPLSAMTATVVPVLRPGSPSPNVVHTTGSATADAIVSVQRAEGKRLKGLQLDSMNEVRKLRELAKASFSGDSKGKECSTSYGFRVQTFSGENSPDNSQPSSSKR